MAESGSKRFLSWFFHAEHPRFLHLKLTVIETPNPGCWFSSPNFWYLFGTPISAVEAQGEVSVDGKVLWVKPTPNEPKSLKTIASGVET